MHKPDISDYSSAALWMSAWHQWWREDPTRPTFDDLATSAGISAEHLHNLLTGRRPLLRAHVRPIARATGLSRREAERLRGLIARPLPIAEPLAAPTDADRAAAFAGVEEAREVLFTSPHPRWAARALVWALAEPHAEAVWSSALQVLRQRGVAATRTRVQIFCVRVSAWQGSTSPATVEHMPEGGLTAHNHATTLGENMATSSHSAAPVDVLDFLDYREFFRCFLAERQRVNARLSQRWLALRLGVTAGQLGNVLAGRRGLRPEIALARGAQLNLDPERARYLAALVRFNDEREPEAALAAWHEFNALRARHGRAPETGVGSPLLSRWYVPVVLELCLQAGARLEPGWIAENLRPRVTVEQATDALDLLRSSGLLGPERAPRAVAPVVRSAEWIGEVLALAFFDDCLATMGKVAHEADWPVRHAELDLEAEPEGAASEEALVRDWQLAVEDGASSARANGHGANQAVFLFYAQSWSTMPTQASGP